MGEIRKKIINLSSAELALRVVSTLDFTTRHLLYVTYMYVVQFYCVQAMIIEIVAKYLIISGVFR